jgi:hypothetical protein
MLREFTDQKGTTWQVFDVYPAARGKAPNATDDAAHLPSRELGEGWLCFQSATEKRRLAPIPPEWEICECSDLETLCANAGYGSRLS